jgi:hypothetical protein
MTRAKYGCFLAHVPVASVTMPIAAFITREVGFEEKLRVFSDPRPPEPLYVSWPGDEDRHARGEIVILPRDLAGIENPTVRHLLKMLNRLAQAIAAQ